MKRRILILCSIAVLGSAVASPALAGTVRNGGSTGMWLLAQLVASSFNKTQGKSGVNIGPVAAIGSGAGISRVFAGQLDIGNSSRDYEPDGRDKATPGLVFTPIAKEGFVVIVHPSNPLCKKGMTEDQVKQIFTGQATSWDQVGGGALGTINVYSRVATSGTQPTFSRLYLGGADVVGKPLQSNLADRSAVQGDKSGVSFVTLAYTLTSKKVCAVPIGGVQPTLKNVASNQFKYWGFQYYVTKGDPAGDAKALIDYALSSSVQKKIISKLAVPVK